MGISVAPSAFRNESYPAYTPKVYTSDELQQLKKKPTEVVVEGDIYRSSATDFKKLSLEELQRETFAVDSSKREYITHSDKPHAGGTKQIVAIRNPNDSDEVLTFELSKKSIDNLKKKFGDSNNFFERGDGVLRLNGEAENFVAGWMKDIRENRNYDEADADKNGRIEGNEAKALTIAFERQNDYEYIGKKLVKVNSLMGEDSYQSLGSSGDAAHLFETDDEKAENKKMGYTYKRNITASQYTKFENTVEKELDHTLQMDADLDGIVTLKEGLSDEFGKDYRQKIIDTTQKFHEHLLRERPSLNDSSRLQHYDIGLNAIISKAEEEEMKKTFIKEGLYIQEQMKIKHIQDQFALSGMGTVDILDAKNAKATPLQKADPLALRSYASQNQLASEEAKINAYS